MATDRNIHWRQIAVEGVAIIASILLAFWIDAWWDERQNRSEEQQILQGLHEEFTNFHEILVDDLGDHLQSIHSLERFLIVIDSDPLDVPGPAVDAVLLEMLNPGTTDLGNGALSALLSSGRIELLTNRNLRASLAAWEGVMDEVRDDQSDNSRMVFERSVPYFMHNGIPVTAAMSNWYETWPISARSVSDDSDALARLLKDPEFRVLVELRYGYKRHLTEEFEAAIVAAEEILSEIEFSLN